MNTLKRATFAVLFCMSAAWGQTIPGVIPNQPMSHEEQVVRTAYARFSYAVQVTAIHKAISDFEANKTAISRAELGQRLKTAALTFELSDFKVGNVTDADIGQTLYSALVTKPSGDVLATSSGYSHFSTDSPADGSQTPQHTQSVQAGASWVPSQTIGEDWEQPWAKMFPLIDKSSWFTRYAAFKVKVSFQGRSRDYRAMFLFGHDPQTGEEYIVPGDTVAHVSGGALGFFVNHNAYPEALIEGGVGRDIPAVRSWLRAQAAPGNPHEDNCNSGRCGVSQQDLQKLEKLPPKLQMKLVPSHSPRLVNASLAVPVQSSLNCPQYNKPNSHLGQKINTLRHTDGGFHVLGDQGSANCTYTDNTATGSCDTKCTVDMDSTKTNMVDFPPTAGLCHATDAKDTSDDQNAVGGGAHCGGGAGGGVKECIACLCFVSVSISKNGVGINVSSDGFYTETDNVGTSCGAMPPAGGGGGGGGDNGNTTPNCNNDNTFVNNPNTSPLDPNCSPIIIDTEGQGFHLTSAKNGVMFDISGTGHPIQLAWTEAGFKNGFLALPDANGQVLDGRHLFGNFTPQPVSQHPNGFLALAVYDRPDQGGNGDGIIDARDAIYSKLRIWIDKNHDGIAQPDELFTLPQVGVVSLSLDDAFSYREDQYGNKFRYRAKVNPRHHRGDNQEEDEVGPWAYDVFFVVK